MSSEDKWIQRLRAAARAGLPEGARLWRDRGDVLFVTDADVRALPGFLVRRRGNLTCLDPDESWFAAIEQAHLPEDDLSRSLSRFRGTPPTAAARAALSAGLKLSDTRCTAAQILLYDRRVRTLAAEALRTGETGGIFAAAVLDALLKNCYNRENKTDDPEGRKTS